MRIAEINMAVKAAALAGKDPKSFMRTTYFVAPSSDDTDAERAGPGNEYPSWDAASDAADAMNYLNPLGGDDEWIASEVTFIQLLTGEWVPMPE